MIKRRTLLAVPGAMAVAAGLQACGGGKSTKSGNVRLLNATSFDSIDLRVSNSNIIAGVAKGAVSGYVEADEGTTAFQVGNSSETTVALTQSDSVSNNTSYTMVAYTTNSTLNAAYFADTEGAPTSGTAKIRLFNGSAEAGSLDLYVTSEAAVLSGSTAINASVNGQRVGSYQQVTAGTWRIRVTGAGDPEDIRLDVSGVVLADQQIATFVVTATGGGVLVNGLLLNQGGTVSGYANTKIRLRVVADLTAAGKVTFADGLGNTSTLTSPSIGSYRTVALDLSALSIQVGSVVVDLSGETVSAGSDVTVLVYGAAATPNHVVVRDDNRLPASTSKCKVRLVHGRNDLASTLSLSVASSQIEDSVAFATVSSPKTVTSGTDINVEVFESGASSALNATTSLQTLVGQAVYTVFAIGDASASLTRVVRDR